MLMYHFDGQGIITNDFSDYINNQLGINNATSYQIRMPFTKGMVHKIDIKGFISKCDNNYEKNIEYMYKDIFGIARDIKKASIFITESMFKCKEWLSEYCNYKKINDPMKYYCDKLHKNEEY